MSANALVELSCPHCQGHFIENAKLVRHGAQAYCPECAQLFTLDGSTEAMRQQLLEARQARRRRKDRVTEMRARWAEPAPRAAGSSVPQAAVPPPPRPPLMISDVLKSLDALLAKLDAERLRAQPPSANG